MIDLDSLSDELIAGALEHDRPAVIDAVETAYRLFAAGDAMEAEPSFLRPPHDPSARIIAKPGWLLGREPVAGVKWISSYPDNLKHGRPRASGVLILNDLETGLPRRILPAAAINAHRTAASAALALRALHPADQAESFQIVGAGVIGWQVAQYLLADGWRPRTWTILDLDVARANRFAAALAAADPTVSVTATTAAALDGDVVVFTTTSATPHVTTPFEARQTILHISLRDLSEAVILGAANYVDCPTLAFRHATSLALAEQAAGHRDFLAGGVLDWLEHGRGPNDRAAIFSPFGLAILDLAVGQWVSRRLDGGSSG